MRISSMSGFKWWKNVSLGMLLEQYLNAVSVDKFSQMLMQQD